MSYLRDTKSILGVILTAVLFSIALPSYGQNKFGSITFSPNTGNGFAYGFSWNYSSRDTARQRATRECRNRGGSGCPEIGWFSNTCGAIAVTPEGGYGTGYGETKSGAESNALSMCRRTASNFNCQIGASQCSTGGQPSTTGFMAEKPKEPAKLTRDQRRKVQSLLAAQGTNPGPADGVFGDRTRSAIKQWQSANNFQATGELTDEQVRALIVAGQQAQAQQAQAQQAATTARKKAKKDLWGSIAFSQESGGGYAYGIVWNSGGREPARQRAVQVCRSEGGTSCAELGWFRNTCASLAVGDRGGAAVGGGKQIAAAESMALSECRNAGNTNCKIEISRCTDRDVSIAGAGTSAVTEKKAETKASGDGCPGGVIVGTYQYPHNNFWQYHYVHSGIPYKATYNGELCNGEPNGKGEILYTAFDSGDKYSYTIYKGEFRNGRPHGKGTSYYQQERKQEEFFVGEWREGLPIKGRFPYAWREGRVVEYQQLHNGPNGPYANRTHYQLLHITGPDKPISDSNITDVLSNSWQERDDGLHYVGD